MIGLKGALAVAAVVALSSPLGAQTTTAPSGDTKTTTSAEVHKTTKTSHHMTVHHGKSHATKMTMKACKRLSHAKMMRNKQCKAMMMRHHHTHHAAVAAKPAETPKT
jgi:hypothetical protein